MTFRHCEILVAVCESGSMTGAAEWLSISQPSVSQAIAELEGDYGAALFERLGKRLVLTSSGELCLGYARRLLRTREELAEAMRREAGSAPLRVGATVTIGTYLLPAFRGRSPHPIYPVVENTARIERLLLEGALDIGLVEGLTSSPALLRERFYRDRLVVVCSPENPAAGRRLQARELEGRGVYIREPGSGSRELFEFAMRRKGLRFRVAGEINNTEGLRNFARADRENFAVISALAVDESVRTVEIPGLELSRDFDIVRHKDKELDGRLAGFVAALKAWRP